MYDLLRLVKMIRWFRYWFGTVFCMFQASHLSCALVQSLTHDDFMNILTLNLTLN